MEKLSTVSFEYQALFGKDKPCRTKLTSCQFIKVPGLTDEPSPPPPPPPPLTHFPSPLREENYLQAWYT